MEPRIEVWRGILPGPNARRQFHFVGQFYQWSYAFSHATLDYRYWAIRKVERPHPGAIQLLLCMSPYNSKEI
jgi:hypothetical protein